MNTVETSTTAPEDSPRQRRKPVFRVLTHIIRDTRHLAPYVLNKSGVRSVLQPEYSVVLLARPLFFLLYWGGKKRVWYTYVRISVQPSTQSTVAADW